MQPIHVLILGNCSDPDAAYLQRRLDQAGAITHYWNTQQFPTQTSLSWHPDLDQGRLILPEGDCLDFEQIHSVFWRSFAGAGVPALADPHQYQVALNDSISLLRSVLQACPARWINSWSAYQFHKEKPLQLRAVQQMGIPIPATLISNDPEAVLQFCRQQQTVFKPVYGGAHTQMVTSDHLHRERLALALKTAPVTLQAYIPGTNIRSYVIGEQVYSAEIRSSQIDFRTDTDTELIPVALPAAIEQACVQIARKLLLEWTAIDWRKTAADDYVFLEANPSPMFWYFEQQTGLPITASLVDLLLAKRQTDLKLSALS